MVTNKEVDVFISHFGKKGMRWGVRNDRVVGTDGGVDVTKGDAKWGAKTLTPKAIIAVNNRMALAIDKDLVGLNARYEGKNLGFNDKTGQYTNPTGKQYLKDYENLATKHATKAAQDVFGKSPSGNWTASARFSMTSGLEVNIVPSKVVHDGLTPNGDGVNITFQVKIDSSGFLLPISSAIKHSFNDVDEFLEHFGKKGMKWGVRKEARLETTRRVAEGKGSIVDKYKVLNRNSALSVARNHGLKGAAAKQVQDMEALKSRVLAGKATTMDLLNTFGGTKIINFG